MSTVAAPSSYPGLFRRLNHRIDKNFPDQTLFLKSLVKARSTNPFSSDQSPKDQPLEAKVSRLIVSFLKDLKLSPRRLGITRDRQNVVCHLGPDRFRKSLILNGHMDTVEPAAGWTFAPFAAEIKDNKLFGLGALDMKASLSAYLFAVKSLLQEKVKLDGRLTLEFVVDEESGAASPYGTQLLLQKGITAKAALIGEPGTGKVAIGHRGGYRFRLTTIGEVVHTGTSAWEKKQKGRNAILDMAKVTCALQKIELPYKPARAFPGRIPVFTFPTRITGGKAINMVPDRCSAEGDVYLMPGNSDKQVRMWIEDCLKQTCPDIVYEITDLTYVPSVEIAKHEEIVDLTVKNCIEVTGRKPKVLGAGPWNDAWMLINRGIPAICGFGPDGDNVHAADEYVDLKSLKQVTEIYARLIVDYLGLQKK